MLKRNQITVQSRSRFDSFKCSSLTHSCLTDADVNLWGDENTIASEMRAQKNILNNLKTGRILRKKRGDKIRINLVFYFFREVENCQRVKISNLIIRHSIANDVNAEMC
jgi:hypothetical protein